MQQDDNAPFSPFKTRRKERSQSSGAQSTDNESISSASFSTEHIQRCSLYFVTARPHAYKQLSESKLLNLLKSMGGRLHCTPALTTGELHSSLVSAIRNLRALIWHNVSISFLDCAEENAFHAKTTTITRSRNSCLQRAHGEVLACKSFAHTCSIWIYIPRIGLSLLATTVKRIATQLRLWRICH